jgi:hypothetical protein
MNIPYKYNMQKVPKRQENEKDSQLHLKQYL